MIRKIARPMVATVYIADGVNTFSNPDKHIKGTQSVLDKLQSVLPKQYASMVPENADTVTRGVGATKTAAGSLLALGKAPRLSAAILAVLSAPTLFTRHAFWSSNDDKEKSDRRNGFITDIALLGGLFIATADTQGKPGLQWRANHAAKRANKAIQSALPGKNETEKFKENATEQATAAVAATKGFLSDAGDKVSSYASDVQNYVDDNKDDWLKTAQSNRKIARKKLVKAADEAQKRAEKARNNASKKAPKLQKKADKALSKAYKKLDKKLKKIG